MKGIERTQLVVPSISSVSGVPYLLYEERKRE
jgi:hypothetical protein